MVGKSMLPGISFVWRKNPSGQIVREQHRLIQFRSPTLPHYRCFHKECLVLFGRLVSLLTLSAFPDKTVIWDMGWCVSYFMSASCVLRGWDCNFTYIENTASDQTCPNMKRVLASSGWIFLRKLFTGLHSFRSSFCKFSTSRCKLFYGDPKNWVLS